MENTGRTVSDRRIEWRTVASLFNLYEVSSEGQLRGLERVTVDGKTLRPRLLTGRPHAKTGYIHYGVGVDGVRYTVMAHRLVCEAFHGPAPEGKPNALHRNGDPGDNRPANLYWGDQSDNNYDSVFHGVHPNARKTHCPEGHEFSPENTYTNPRGWRKCRVCILARQDKIRSTDEYRSYRKRYDAGRKR